LIAPYFPEGSLSRAVPFGLDDAVGWVGYFEFLDFGRDWFFDTVFNFLDLLDPVFFHGNCSVAVVRNLLDAHHLEFFVLQQPSRPTTQ